MQLTTILPVLLSTLGLSSAAALANPPVFRSTDLDIGRSQGGVAWRFNLTAAKTENTPGFNTHCEGTSSNVTQCSPLSNNQTVITRVQAKGYPNFNIWVEHRWFKSDGIYQEDYRASGSVNVTDETKRFQIKPDRFVGAG